METRRFSSLTVLRAMKTSSLICLSLTLLGSAILLPAANNQVLGWNNLGMHCMDSDYSVFSILPPYNTIEAQLIVGGKLVTNGSSYTITYQAVADPDGSINASSLGKGNFKEFMSPLYGAPPQPEFGLTPWPMPGAANLPQRMLFERTNQPAPGAAVWVNWFRAEGIPITPYDDAGRKNPYPLMRLLARDSGGAILATSDIVLPVSDEMDCRACHASGQQAAARPEAGWVWSRQPERDYRLNILRLHDERQFRDHAPVYQAALAARGFNPQGLYQGVVGDRKPVLCATCHASEALATGSYSNIPPLTASVHSKHASVMDPDLHITLDNSAHRAACYRCHPGSTTKCLRGAMGGSVAADGSMSMQCQSCHGTMSQVGARDRVGWFMEPNCQSCHTGHATSNSGQIRFTSVFTESGQVRPAAHPIFATQPNTPAPGLSLYRFSTGHGGLQCSACHGSTHAEFPATHRNDNLRNQQIQGHAGVTAECVACHVTMPNNNTTATGGPHGMHPIGQGWVGFHHDAIHSDSDRQKCAACHGADFRGTVLSRTLGPRTLTASLDNGTTTLNLFQGAVIGCYTCHNGPDSEDLNTAAAPTVSNVSTNTLSGQAIALKLPVVGANAKPRLISQPAHGSVGLDGTTATYFPDPGFIGTDRFTFAAWNGAKNSLLATGLIAVAQGPYAISAKARVPADYPAGWPVPFQAIATLSNTVDAVRYEWDFGDDSERATGPQASHAYSSPGSYQWSLRVQVGTAETRTQGSVLIQPPAQLAINRSGPNTQLVWAPSSAAAVLEHTLSLAEPGSWSAATNRVTLDAASFETWITPAETREFFRLRQVE